MAKETFKTVEGFERYMVSNTGRVITTRGTVKELKPQKDSVGYYHVRLYPEDYRFGSYPNNRGKRPKLFKIHSLVARTFIPKHESKERLEINHKSGDKSDNRVENLEYVTRQQNMAHSYETGLHNGAAYKAAKKRRKACYAVLPDGSKVYYESRVHATIDFKCSPYAVVKSISHKRTITRGFAKGVQFFHLDELPPGETFKKILHIERLLIEFNDRYFPTRKAYMDEWNKMRREQKRKKLEN